MMSRLPNWKKSRLVRVSRLVADLHRAPPKHGSSFLLHTGFPTSLFDLFLKNRDRFNPPPPTATPSDQLQQLPPSSSMTDHPRQPTGAGGNNTNTNTNTNTNKKKILFKVFLILGLALGAAQFAWVMAAAAFSLLSLELLGKSRAQIISREKCNIEDQINKPRVVGSADHSLPDERINRATDTTVLITDHHLQPKSRPNLFKRLMKKKLRHGKKQISTWAADTQNDDRENEKISSGRSELANANRNQGKSCCYLNHSILMVIVLSGLIAGRIPALLVTVSCMVSHSQIRGFIFCC